MNFRPAPEPQSCFHCGLPIPAHANFPVKLNGKAAATCCPGCQAVAQTIIDNGLGEYYQHRQNTAGKVEPLPEELLQQLKLYDNDEIQQSFVLNESAEIREAALILEGITCSACVWLNERHLASIKGVLSADINYTSHRARVRWDNTQIKLSQILEAIAAIGYRAHPFDAARQEAIAQQERKTALLRIYLAGLSMMQVMMYAIPLYLADSGDMSRDMEGLMRWASLILTLPVVLYSSIPFYQGSWRDLKAGRAGMDVPVALGVITAFVASSWATLTQSGEVYFDSVSMFVFLLLSGRYLEMLARRKAGSAVEKLVKLIPSFAHRLPDFPQSKEPQEAAVAQLQVGDYLLVREGETVPADGMIVEGRTQVDEALLTGEGRPIDKNCGDELIGGSLNRANAVVLQITRIGAQSTLSGIVRLLDRAIAEKPRFSQLADQVSAWFVVALLLIAAATAIGWYFYDPQRALWITVSVLVISCPCALSLATPAALATATGKLAQLGLLITRGHALETLSRVDCVVFDKTGTLTTGQMQIAERFYFGDATLADAVAKSLEQQSSHPIAQAFSRLQTHQQLFGNKISYTPGFGIEGTCNQTTYRIGNYHHVALLVGDVPCPAFSAPTDSTLIYLGCRGAWLACYAIVDELRPEAPAVIHTLRQQGIHLVLLSGDRQAAVENMARRLELDVCQAERTPQQKLESLVNLQRQGKTVLMIGDGINDAPVLAAAQVSIAIGSGSDIARASGDMVLLAETLRPVLHGMTLSRRCMAIIRQNLAWALIYNVIALPLALAGLITPWLAGLGMAGSSLLVVANALRLARAPAIAVEN